MTHDDQPGPEDRDEVGRLDEDSAWAAIVAGYGDRVLGDPADDVDAPPAAGEPGTTPGTPPGDASPPPEISVFDRPSYDARSAWRGDASEPVRRPEEHEESDDRFVPPEAPPLPRPRGVRGVAWVGVLGVPLLYLVLTLADVRLVSGAGLLLLLWFVAGFGYLIGTMRDESGDGWDDGARL